jgi:hypothetical protein
MGFLDDAIREHLELKRRRGADPAEIERAEREALGPARRAPEPAEAEAYHDQPHHLEHEFDYEDHDSEPHLSPVERDEAAALEAVAGAHEVHEPDPSPEPHPYEAGPEAGYIPSRLPEEHLADEEPASGALHEPAPPAEAHNERAPETDSFPEPGPAPHPAADPPPASEPSPHLSQPTQEYQVEFEEEPAAETEPMHEGTDEDVLEETPEFLQDAPEHDRLWFEQKPPRDFDFDR